ncbi:MAG TPA: hypothetical protein VND45_04480, partial [Thermoanaerobaculia bacterium]|nr:hypothetical protein [Thermoanaerobaculia bacterium]
MRKKPEAMQQLRAFVVVLVLCALTASCASAPDQQRWSDTYEARLEVLALLQTLNADILAGSSATATLERWCREHE